MCTNNTVEGCYSLALFRSSDINNKRKLFGISVVYSLIMYIQQVLLLHEASKASFSRVFDLEANDLEGKDNERTR